MESSIANKAFIGFYSLLAFSSNMRLTHAVTSSTKDTNDKSASNVEEKSEPTEAEKMAAQIILYVFGVGAVLTLIICICR